MTNTDSTATTFYCSGCSKVLVSQYYWADGKYFCRDCFTGRMLQNKNWYLISDNVCHCDAPVEISICPKCGKVKYNASKKENS